MRGRRDNVNPRRRVAAVISRVHLLLDHIPRFDVILPPQRVPLRFESLEVQHLRRTMLQRLRVQLAPPLQKPPMTVCWGDAMTQALSDSNTFRTAERPPEAKFEWYARYDTSNAY